MKNKEFKMQMLLQTVFYISTIACGDDAFAFLGHISHHRSVVENFCYSAQHGHVDIAKRLLEKRANIDLALPCCHGASPLAMGVQNGHFDYAKMLIQNGAEVNLVREGSHSPLFHCARGGHIQMAQLLLKNGAQVNLPGKHGELPLFMSAQSGHVEMARWLINNGANVDLADEEGATSLYVSVLDDHTDVAKLLIERRADTNHCYRGFFPIAIAAGNENLELVKALKPHATGLGLTHALHRSIGIRHEVITLFLLESGADKEFFLKFSDDVEAKQWLTIYSRTEKERLAIGEELHEELCGSKQKFKTKPCVPVQTPKQNDSPVHRSKPKHKTKKRKPKDAQLLNEDVPKQTLEEVKEEITLDVNSIESLQNEIARLQAELTNAYDENENLVANVNLLEDANKSLNQLNENLKNKIREQRYLSKTELYLFEARLIAEDVIEFLFPSEKMDTTAASIAVIPSEETELKGALHYLREAGNCVCHQRNLSELRAGRKSQFTMEQVVCCFRVIHNKVPDYSPSFKSRFFDDERKF